MDYLQLKKELLPHLRGRVPQKQVDKKLGLTFAKTYRWESGQTRLKWSDFIGICQVLKVPIEDVLGKSFSFHGDVTESALLVRHFFGTSTQKEISDALKFSRFILARWLKGASEPTFEQMMALMDFASPGFLRFIELITDGTILPVSKERLAHQLKESF